MGIGDADEHFDEFVHAFFNAGVECGDVLAPFGKALLALRDVGFEIGDRGFAGFKVGGGSSPRRNTALISDFFDGSSWSVM